VEALALPPSYDNIRESVEKYNPDDKTSKAERIFVTEDFQNGFIMHYRSDVTLRDVVEEAKSRNHKEVTGVLVFRRDTKPSLVFRGAVESLDKVTFILKPEDAVFVEDHDTRF